ncbi:MAG: VCBS repeat-containing protein [Deltaproteobacteria bacterium]|nr:VCBS repeat-containing protein [Deltaproteobacteria bacterium]
MNVLCVAAACEASSSGGDSNEPSSGTTASSSGESLSTSGATASTSSSGDSSGLSTSAGSDSSTGGLALECGGRSVAEPIFAAPVDSAVSGRLAALADMDASGSLDVLVVDPGASASLVLDAGQSPSPEILQIEADPPFALTVVSADDDAVPDLALVSMTQDSLQILIGVGDGTFSSGAEIPLSDGNAIGIASLDVDADGDDDLFVARELEPLLLMNDSGFQEPTLVAVEGLSPFATGDIAVGDFDNVPGHDVIMHGSRVFASDGLGGLTSVPSVSSTMGGFAVVGGFDGEIAADLALAKINDFGRGGAALSIAVGTPDYFGTPQDLPLDCNECATRDKMSVGDVNDDSQDDIVYPSAHGISILLGCGDATFAGPLTIEFAEPLQRVMVGELNGDLRLDLLTTDASATKLIVVSGLGSG